MTTPVPTRSQSDHPTPALSRRSVIAGAAWSVPVIVAVTATPAFAAASNAPTVTASAPNMQAPASGQVVVTAMVKDASGNPLSGQPVSFTGPSGTSFNPATSTTNGAGVATSTLTTSDAWALPGSSVTVTALSNGASGTAPLTVLGANAYGAGSNSYRETGTTSTASSVLNATQLAYAFTSPIRSLASGGKFTLAALDDGTVWAIGRNGSGQLGDGTTQDRTTWARVPGITDAIAVAASTNYSSAVSYALLSNGTIMSWGSGWEGELGRGTVGTGGAIAAPGLIQNVSTAVAVAAGQTNGYALLTNGVVLAWGDNSQNQLGNGTSGGTSGVPAAVSGVTTAVELVAGSASAYARLDDGTLLAWGRNDYGQLGNGSTNATSTPTSVMNVGSGNPGAIAIAAGNSTGYAVRTDGTVVAWGVNASGELGNGTSGWNTNTANPAAVSGITTATAITATYSSASAFLSDGSLKAWGANAFGQLGTGDTSNAVTPVTVPHTSNATRFAACAPVSNAFLLVVGDRVVTLTSTSSQITAGSTADLVATVSTPAGTTLAGQTVTFAGDNAATTSPATATTDPAGQATTTVSADTWTPPGNTLTVTANSAGYRTSKALTVLGANAYAFGKNRGSGSGNWGFIAGTDSTDDNITSATQLQRVFPSPLTAAVGSNDFAYALLADGTVWSVGTNNAYGQLGDGTTTGRSTWQMIPTLSNVTQLAANAQSGYALLRDGTIRAWGSNDGGVLGDGTTTDSATPVTVSGITTATQISAGIGYACALLSDGTIWSWGYNGYGQFGDGTTNASGVPVQATGVTTARQIATGYVSSYALLDDGTIRAWGMNRYGQLGDGTTTDQLTPVTVQNVSNVAQITAGSLSAYARHADGTISAWGANYSGQLGDGTTTDSSTAVTVQGISTATDIAAVAQSGFAILGDRSLLSWGENDSGLLGDGTTNARATPGSIVGTSEVTALGTSSVLGEVLYLIR